MKETTAQRSTLPYFGKSPRLLAGAFLLTFLAIPGTAAAEAKSESGKAYVEHRKGEDRHQRDRARGDRHRGEKRYDSNDDRRRRDGHRRGYNDRRDDHRGHRDRDRYRNNRDRHRYDNDRHRYDRRHNRQHDRYRYDNHRDGYRYDRGRNHRYDSRHRYGHNQRRFSVPRRILHDLIHTYHEYLYGRVFYKAHGHHHDIYRFPVYYESHVEYRPYAYCEGQYFATGVFERNEPRFDIHLSF